MGRLRAKSLRLPQCQVPERGSRYYQCARDYKTNEVKRGHESLQAEVFRRTRYYDGQ